MLKGWTWLGKSTLRRLSNVKSTNRHQVVMIDGVFDALEKQTHLVCICTPVPGVLSTRTSANILSRCSACHLRTWTTSTLLVVLSNRGRGKIADRRHFHFCPRSRSLSVLDSSVGVTADVTEVVRVFHCPLVVFISFVLSCRFRQELLEVLEKIRS